MTKVRRTVAVALPLVVAAVGIGVGATPADAAICWPLAGASITGPSGPLTAGSTIHASARVRGMLLGAHLQVTGPGLDQQVGRSAISGVIGGDVLVPRSGAFRLAVVGNSTGCVYATDAFSARPRPSTPKPTPHRSAAEAPATKGGARASRRPRRIRLGATLPRTPLSGLPLRAPSVAPDESGPRLRLPSADPQVAAPPVRQPQPRASNAAESIPPIKWGQSVAIAAVLLLLSAHMGMWSRRQRLSGAGRARAGSEGPAGQASRPGRGGYRGRRRRD